MKLSKLLLFGLLGLALVSCNKGEPLSDSGREMSFRLDGLDLQVATKATVDTVTTANLGGVYWQCLSGSTNVYAPASYAVSGSTVNTGKFWPAGGAIYNYRVANVAFSNAGVITASNTTDIVVGTASGVTNNSCSVVLDHIFARTGKLTMNTQPGYTISDVSWKIKSRGSASGIAGNYTIGSGWSSSGVTALAEEDVVPPFSSDSDLYLIPGDYTVTVTYTLTKGGYVETFTRAADVTLQQGKINSITGTANAGNAEEIQFTVSVTPWGSEELKPTFYNPSE